MSQLTDDPIRQAFYDLDHDDGRYERINGQIIKHPGASYLEWRTAQKITMPLAIFCQKEAKGIVSLGSAMVPMSENDFLPWMCFWPIEIARLIHPDQELMPIPSLIFEVESDFSKQILRDVKLVAYATHGVKELWILNPNSNILEQYHNPTGKALELLKNHTLGSMLTSIAVPGFELDIAAVFAD